MRVIVEVASGSARGKKIVLDARQLIEVGRTDWADFAVRDDARMSSRHFRLETDTAGCYVEDLGSSNGTFVNRSRIAARTALRDGDEVAAGETTFLVRVQTGATSEFSLPATPKEPEWSDPWSSRPPEPTSWDSASPAMSSVAHAPSPPAPAALPATPVNYTLASCSSGLTLCQGSAEQISASELAILLCRFLPVYLIVDFRNVGAAMPGELASPRHLFDWLDPATAAAVSPVLVAQDELLTWPTLVEQGWGKDAVVCLFSSQERGAMLDHLRRSCRAKPQASAEGGAILGVCWPSLLGPILAHFTPRLVRDLMAGIDAVLVEASEPPGAWQLYGGGQLVKMLDDLGFCRQDISGR